MFNKYQKRAASKNKPHRALTAEEAALLDWALGASGEAGEISEMIKHHIFSGEPLNKVECAKELGDLLWYISAIATHQEIDLAHVAELNTAKLDHRYAGEGYTDEGSQQRHESEKAFADTMVYKRLEASIMKKPAPLNVIFIGPDGSGKTTIAKLLTEKFAAAGFTYHKCDYRQENKPSLALQLLESQTNIIYDRFYHPDDMVYSSLISHNTSEQVDWSSDYWQGYNKVLHQMYELNTVYVYVTADMKTLTDRSAKWADNYVTIEDLPFIMEMYEKFLRSLAGTPITAFRIDTTTGTPEEHAAHLSMCIHRAQAMYASLKDLDTFLTEEDKIWAAKADGKEKNNEIDATDLSDEGDNV